MLLTALVSSCKKAQPEMNPQYEGCDCAKEVSANFLMEEMATPINWPYEAQLTDTDTMYAGRNVHFYALEADAEYTWIIGAEEIHDREFYRYFGNALAGQTLEMKLIVNKKPNHICLPNDDGKDTVVRYLTIVSEPLDLYSTPKPLLEGVFRLKDANMADSIDVTIEILGNIDLVTDRLRMTNYDGQGTVKDFFVDGYTYRQFWFTGTCYTNSTFKNDISNITTIELNHNTLGSCQDYLLKGRKL
jgi:hypothetical protein